MNKHTLRYLLFFFLYSLSVNAQLTTSSAVTDSVMVKSVLVGPGVFAKNIHYQGTNTARGTFSYSGGFNLGFSSGIMLTSGSLSNAIGPNNSTGAGTDNPTPGDPLLDLIAPNTQDAAVLEFDFLATSDSVELKFIFGSEEYSDYVGSNCNDVTGFFINGPGFSNTNIALVPGTLDPITCNNVNNGWAASSTSPSGPCMNCAYFRDNTGGVNLQYDGLTTVLTAGVKVAPCELYHLKLAIADRCDGAFDSGIFLQANSFKAIGQIHLLVNGSISTSPDDTVYICPGDSVLLSMPVCNDYNWSTGDTVQSIWVDTIGTFGGYTLNGIECFAFSNLCTVLWGPNAANISTSGPTNFCAGDSVQLTAVPGFSYLWSTGDTIQSISVYTNGNYSVTVTYANGCTRTSTPLSITVNSLPIVEAGITTTIIQGNSTLIGGTPTAIGNPPFTYSWTPTTGLDSSNVANPTASPQDTTTYTVLVTDANGCSSNDLILINVNVPIGIHEKTNEIGLSVFPNPTYDWLNITGDNIQNGVYNFKLMNVYGQTLFSEKLKVANHSVQKQLSLALFSSGIYFLIIENGKTRIIEKVQKID